MLLIVTIDPQSGFCAGVIHAIACAQNALEQGTFLYSLGAIVHNNEELERLRKQGLQVIDHAALATLPSGSKVLIRAHGEPPSTYSLATTRGLNLLECTCGVVLQLQKQIKAEYQRIHPLGGMILLFGRRHHAEVNGLVGQVDGNARVIESEEEVNTLLFPDGPVSIFSQTTQDPERYQHVCQAIEAKMRLQKKDTSLFTVFPTICRQVANRRAQLHTFAQSHSVILFVSGKDSSNGKVLFQICLQANKRSYNIENEKGINPSWFHAYDTVGICGATSTPKWLMEQIAQSLSQNTWPE